MAGSIAELLEVPKEAEFKARANRINALKSTGPKTLKGKLRSAQNAVKHGLFAESIVLPGEQVSEFLALRIGFHTDLNPTDTIEMMMVERIVLAQWKLQRAQRAEQALHVAVGDDLERAGRSRYRRMYKEMDNYPYDPDDLNSQRMAEVVKIEAALLQRLEMGQDGGCTLAADLTKPSPALERLARYEHRLQQQFYRALRELRIYRTDKAAHCGREEEQPLSAFILKMARELEKAVKREAENAIEQSRQLAETLGLDPTEMENEANAEEEDEENDADTDVTEDESGACADTTDPGVPSAAASAPSAAPSAEAPDPSKTSFAPPPAPPPDANPHSDALPRPKSG